MPNAWRGSGKHAQRDFGQADFGIWRGQTHMRAQRQFEAAAQGRAVQSGDHWFRAAFDQIDQRGQIRLAQRFAKFGNIGARGKCAPLCHKHNARDAGIGNRLGHGLPQGVPNRVRQGVYRWVVDRQTGNAIMMGNCDGAGHGLSFWAGARSFPR
jgi:hypothetical protein